MDSEKMNRIISIVQSMNKEGLSISDIRGNLKAMGLADNDVEMIMSKASAVPTVKEIHEQVRAVSQSLEEGGHIRPILEEVQAHREDTEEMHDKISEMHGSVTESLEHLENIRESADEHAAALEEVRGSVSELKEMHEALHEKVADTGMITDELRSIKELLLQMKPAITALMELEKQIISSNKDILLELKKK